MPNYLGLEASVMERELYIPLPVTEENRDQYFEELSIFTEAENWVGALFKIILIKTELS